MNWDVIASALAISAGAVVMAASIFRFGPILETTPYLEPRERQGLERFLKIHRPTRLGREAQAQVPFTKKARAIAVLLEQRRQRQAVALDQGWLEIE